MRKKLFLGLAAANLLALNIQATGRLFTYTYEPETMPKGTAELEQWITLRSQRNRTVGQENYTRWDMRTELEYGVTDQYTVGFYLNYKSESYRETDTGEDVSKFTFKGISLENRWMIMNPAKKPVGLTLYLEPSFWGDGAELEEKLILGQRHGDWKWALNLIHATEWKDNFHETIGEVGATAGLVRHLGSHWAVGLEYRLDSEVEEYRDWDSLAMFLGPVVSYRKGKFWGTLTVLPQFWGHNFDGNPDGHTSLDLRGHERINIRLMLGFEL